MEEFEILSLLEKNAKEASLTANQVNIYSVYDSVSKVFSDIFVSLNDEVVDRNYANLLNSNEGKYHLYRSRPDSFMLFRLGSYNMFDGIITPGLSFLHDFTYYVADKKD